MGLIARRCSAASSPALLHEKLEGKLKRKGAVTSPSLPSKNNSKSSGNSMDVFIRSTGDCVSFNVCVCVVLV